MLGRISNLVVTGSLLLTIVMVGGCNPTEGDFVGNWTLTDPERTYDEYHAFINLRADRTFWVQEYFFGWLGAEGDGHWSFDNGRFWMAPSYGVAEFSGEVAWDSDHFRATGQWSNGTPGTLVFDRNKSLAVPEGDDSGESVVIDEGTNSIL